MITDIADDKNLFRTAATVFGASSYRNHVNGYKKQYLIKKDNIVSIRAHSDLL